jgi:serine/threonine protein kinase
MKIIEKLHDIGFCHTDIKPDNILLDRQFDHPDKSLFLIDFGEAVKYLKPDGEHVEETFVNKFGGNYVFASKNVLGGSKNSRRDDIIQIVYSLVFMIDPCQHWIFDEKNDVISYKQIRDMKI